MLVKMDVGQTCFFCLRPMGFLCIRRWYLYPSRPRLIPQIMRSLNSHIIIGFYAQRGCCEKVQNKQRIRGTVEDYSKKINCRFEARTTRHLRARRTKKSKQSGSTSELHFKEKKLKLSL